MRAKHTFLGEFPPTGIQSPLAQFRDLKRAERIYDAAFRWFGERKLVVLDYGGGEGKLTIPFRDRGHRCLLVDYADRPLPGVRRIASEIDQVDPDLLADVIICSHVLEHLADPLETLEKLRQHLAPGGVLYSEVPDQVWAGIRLEEDPVTHINFFTERSFVLLHQRAGYDVLDHANRPGSYGVNQTPVLSILAGPSPKPAHGERTMDGEEADTPRYLRPGRLYSLRRLLRYYVLARLSDRLLARWLGLRRSG
jgi:SAM-dependent methyltransferase